MAFDLGEKIKNHHQVDQQDANNTMRVFNGKEEFPSSNICHTLVALAIWLGAIHFNVALVIVSLLFLSPSKALLLVSFFLTVHHVISFSLFSCLSGLH